MIGFFKTEIRDDQPVTVHYCHEDEEPMVRYFKDGSGHPGWPEETEITAVFDEDNNSIDDLTEDEIAMLETLAKEHVQWTREMEQEPV